MSQVLIAYIPVLHQGYLQFLSTQTTAQTIFILGEELILEFAHLRKDIRALKPHEIQATVQTLLPEKPVKLLNRAALENLAQSDDVMVMPDEDIMHELADKYLSAEKVIFVSVFLRWDKKQTLAQKEPTADEVISQTEFDQKMMQLAYDQSDKSADWWRQVGAILVKDGQVLLTAHNHHLPLEQQPYFDGDPRGNFHKGEHIELSTAMHAEADIICQAAKRGIRTADCELYVSTFPCPVCAKLVAYSGITKVFYAEGYSMVNGAEVMKQNGVALVRVIEQV